MTNILIQANSFDWYLVDSVYFCRVLDWFIAKYDPKCVIELFLVNQPVSLCSAVLTLLKTVSGFNENEKLFHSTTATKRRVFLRSMVKCLATAQSQNRSLVNTLKTSFAMTIRKMFSLISSVLPPIADEENQVIEAGTFVAEIFSLFEEDDLSNLLEETFITWVRDQRRSLVALAVLQQTNVVIQNPIIFGTIVEVCLEHYFGTFDRPNWQGLAPNVANFASYHTSLEQILISNAFYLTLHALLRKRVSGLKSSVEQRPIVNLLMQMFTKIKPSEDSESKIILLACFTLRLFKDQKDIENLFQQMADNLAEMAADKSGLLSTLGFKRTYNPSSRFKLLCLAIAATLSLLLKNEYKVELDDKHITALERVHKNKQFHEIQADVSTVLASYKTVTNVDDLVQLIENLASQLYNKFYFSF